MATDMTALPSGPPFVTDGDVDALAWQFLHSPYARDDYADWPLDRRLDGFLRRQRLGRLVEDGDTYGLILDRVMAYIAARARLSD